ncbi:hypothetical protein D3C86_1487100 [compost metagenome]
MDDGDHGEILGVGLGQGGRHAEHLHDRALHGVLLDIHHLRLQASHFGRRYPLLHAIAVGGRHAHANPAFGLVGANHREVEIHRLGRRIEAVRLRFDLRIEFVLGQVVRKTDSLRFRQHGRHAKDNVLGTNTGLAKGSLQRDAHGLDVDDVAIGNGVAVQQFAGAFFQPEVVFARPNGQLHDLDAGRPDIHADRSPAQKTRQDAPSQGDPLTFELAHGMTALMGRAS